MLDPLDLVAKSTNMPPLDESQEEAFTILGGSLWRGTGQASMAHKERCAN